MNERAKKKKRIWRTIDVVLGEESKQERKSKNERVKEGMKEVRMSHVHTRTQTHTHTHSHLHNRTQTFEYTV